MPRVIVLGAGMVGVATALALQQRGREVTLIDRGAPGRAASYGNAGIIQVEAVEPYAMPWQIGPLLRYALNLDNAVHYQLRALPESLKPLLRYFRFSRPDRHLSVSAVYSRLVVRSTTAHAPWVAQAGAQHLVKHTGYLQLYRRERMLDKASEQAQRLSEQYGVQHALLDSVQLASFEPALQTRVAGALHWQNAWTCTDPGALVHAYAELFVAKGGQLTVGDARTLFSRAPGGPWSVLTRDGLIQAPDVVVALGAWSPQLLANLGYRIEMVRKRGYHQHWRTARSPQRPIYDAERAVLYCPMDAGVRVTTGAELARMSSTPSPVQLARGVRSAHELLSLSEAVEGQPWSGWRPCMPDMLPVVGSLPRHKGLWAHFGHGHQGFTLGPVTAQALSDLIDGNQCSEETLSLSPSRLTGL